MKTVFYVVLGCVVVVGGFVALILFGTAESREIARQFVLDASSGAYEEARAVLHPDLAAEFPVERLEEGFEAAAPFVTVSFTQSGMRNSLVNLEGTAATAGGCESPVTFSLQDGLIVSFNIAVICPGE